MSRCSAKIRPFRTVNETELQCDREKHLDDAHRSLLKDYAFPGSETEIAWFEKDRRTFYGAWSECPSTNCLLPRGHPRDHDSG
jgi:hypothetical protein